MSVRTEDQTSMTTLPKATVFKPMALVACCGALVTLIAAAISGTEALLFASAGTLLGLLLFGMTHLVDWVLASLAAVSSNRNHRLALTKRLGYGMLLRSVFAILAIALATRYYGVDSKMAVAIALPLYGGLLLAEIAYALAKQGKAPRYGAEPISPLQARI